MKSCATCRDRDICVKVCAQVEARLPKEYTGKDTRREVCMDTRVFEAVSDSYSYESWSSGRTARRYPKANLSVLSAKEKNALMLIADGMSMRAAARRLKINLNALQCRVASARRKLLAGQSADVSKGGEMPPLAGKGGSR